MTSPLHSKQTLTDGIHSTVSYEYTNQAARMGASGFTAEDKYKLAFQISDGTVWLLSDVSVPSWTLISSGSLTGDLNATYVVLASTGSLSNERVLSTSGTTGLTLTDNGPGAAVTLGINNNVVATISGSKFSGPVTASVGIDLVTQSLGGANTVFFAREYNNGNCGGQTTIDWTRGQKQLMTLTASVTATFASGSNPPGISNYLLRIVQGSSGGPFTIQWPSSSIAKWSGAASPTLSSGANKIDILTFYYNGSQYFGVGSLNFA